MDNLRNSLWWRLAAVVAVALLALTAVLGVWLIIRNPLTAIIFGVTTAGFAAVAWQGLFRKRSGPNWPYLTSMVVLFLALTFEVINFFRDSRNVELMLVVLVLAALSVGLVTILRRRYLQARGSEAIVPVGEKPFLIINPKSGSGRAIKQQIPELAKAKGIQVLMLEQGGSLTGLVQQAVDGGATVLGMSGGDGSLGVGAAAAMSHDIPLVVLPGGTKCHFARDIGLDPEQMADAMRAFGGREERIDTAEINGRVFLNNASFGIYADIVNQPGYRERKFQSALEVLEKEGAVDGYPLSFKDDEGKRHERAVVVLVGVNRYETLNVVELGSRKRLDEGVLQVTAVSRLQESLLKQLTGSADVSQWVADEFSIAGNSSSLEAGVDGELVKFDSPVSLKIKPRSLRLMVPPEGILKRRSMASIIENLRKYAFLGKLPHD